MGIDKLRQVNARRVLVPIHAFRQARGVIMQYAIRARRDGTWDQTCTEQMKRHLYSLQLHFLENDPNAEMLVAFGWVLSDLLRWLTYAADFHTTRDKPLEDLLLWLIEGENQQNPVKVSTSTVTPASFLGLRGLATFGTKIGEEWSTAELIKSWCVEKVREPMSSGGGLDVYQIIQELKKIADSAVNSLVSELNGKLIEHRANVTLACKGSSHVRRMWGNR